MLLLVLFKVDAQILEAANAALSSAPKLFYRTSHSSISERHQSGGFTSLSRVFAERSGTARSYDAMMRSINSLAAKGYEAQLGLTLSKNDIPKISGPDQELVDDNEELGPDPLVIMKIPGPRGQAGHLVYTYRPHPDRPGAIQYAARYAFVDFEIANDYVILTQSNRSLLSSRRKRREKDSKLTCPFGWWKWLMERLFNLWKEVLQGQKTFLGLVVEFWVDNGVIPRPAAQLSYDQRSTPFNATLENSTSNGLFKG